MTPYHDTLEKMVGAMPSSQHIRLTPAAPEPQTDEIDSARRRLAKLDATVFSGAPSVSPIQQNDLIRRAVRKLFGHGL
jgi:hypothetical protein